MIMALKVFDHLKVIHTATQTLVKRFPITEMAEMDAVYAAWTHYPADTYTAVAVCTDGTSTPLTLTPQWPGHCLWTPRDLAILLWNQCYEHGIKFSLKKQQIMGNTIDTCIVWSDNLALQKH
jgi:hypothetical protein